jgi:hypothetical protein
MTATPTSAGPNAARSSQVRPFTAEVPEAELMGRVRAQAQRVPAVPHRNRRSRHPRRARPLPAPRRVAADHHARLALVYFNEVDRGNHFAAWQEPELFTTEIRAGFRTLS